MLDTILVPLDGSSSAEAILDHLYPLASRTGSTLELVHAVWPGNPGAVADVVPGDGAIGLDEAGQSADAYLEGVAARVRQRGLDARTQTLYGPPAEAINEVARGRAPMIAMMTHGRTGASRWLLGSVAERVLRRSPAPLLLLRSNAQPRDQGDTPWSERRILVPAESERAAAIAPVVAGLVGQLHADVDLLHVVDSPSGSGETNRGDGLLERLRGDFLDQGVTASPHLRHAATPARGILDYLERTPEVGLIVMRTHGRENVPRWVLGSVAEAVVRRSDVPVLVIRKPPTGRELRQWLPEAYSESPE